MRPTTAAAASFATVVSDLDRRRVVEVLDGRSRRRVERYLGALPEPRREAIEVVSIDPYEAYRQAIRNELPWARIVVDHFHLVRGANTALDPVRRARQREHASRRPKGVRRSGTGASWRQDLYRTRHRPLKGARTAHTARAPSALHAVRTRTPDRRSRGAQGSLPLDLPRPDRREAERRLDHFLDAVERTQLPAFTAFADGVRLWRTELLAYLDEPTTNGNAEGAINKIKAIKRRAHMLPTLTGIRDRVLLARRRTGPRRATPPNRREPIFQPLR